jgi:hypothetical protein
LEIKGIYIDNIEKKKGTKDDPIDTQRKNWQGLEKKVRN